MGRPCPSWASVVDGLRSLWYRKGLDDRGSVQVDRDDSGLGVGPEASSLGPCWAYWHIELVDLFVTILMRWDTCRDLDESKSDHYRCPRFSIFRNLWMGRWESVTDLILWFGARGKSNRHISLYFAHLKLHLICMASCQVVRLIGVLSREITTVYTAGSHRDMCDGSIWIKGAPWWFNLNPRPSLR